MTLHFLTVWYVRGVEEELQGLAGPELRCGCRALPLDSPQFLRSSQSQGAPVVSRRA